eukprot:GEZU01026495.1.p1 GENE.GEZU01026495.1~~GEZU01026495.1.p1  ORF type:complete len:840 (+),score=185.05 GEZU01026495.1:594-3113(+)
MKQMQDECCVAGAGCQSFVRSDDGMRLLPLRAVVANFKAVLRRRSNRLDLRHVAATTQAFSARATPFSFIAKINTISTPGVLKPAYNNTYYPVGIRQYSYASVQSPATTTEQECVIESNPPEQTKSSSKYHFIPDPPPLPASSKNNSKSKNRRAWHDVKLRRKFFDDLAKDLGLAHLDDWYSVTTQEVSKRGGRGLLNHFYGGSLVRALQSLYPDHPWQVWRFASVPKGFWEDRENHRRFFDHIAQELQLKDLDGWYNVTAQQVAERGGGGLLRAYYGDSLCSAVQAIYPEHHWEVWRFQVLPRGFWENLKSQRQLFERIAHQLGIRSYEDWYSVTGEEIKKNHRGGAYLLNNCYNGSLIRALQAIYPEHPWEASKFSSLPRGFWRDIKNHRLVFDQAARELGIQQPEDWYSFNGEDLRNKNNAAYSLMNSHYGSSLIRALQVIYPEHPWEPWRFARLPQGFWDDLCNQRQFFDRIAQQLGIRELDGWYDVTAQEVLARGGSGLLNNHYAGSLVQALKAVYPEHQWNEWRFSSLPRGFWEDPKNQRQFFDRIAVALNVAQLDDWYRVTTREVLKLGGSGLLKHSGSLVGALRTAYPEHPWKLWKFSFIPRRVLSTSWGKEEEDEEQDSRARILRDYIEHLEAELHIARPEDWSRVSAAQIRTHVGGYSIIEQNGGLEAVLYRVYPDKDWRSILRLASSSSRSKKKRSTQRWLHVTIRKIFPNTEIVEDYFHPELRFEDSRDPMQLDVFIPSLRLAFEYNGEQHYRDLHAFGSGGGVSNAQERDQQKIEACQRAGITLVIVPYWWDRTAESVVATLHRVRPDLVPHPPVHGQPIPSTHVP